MMKEKTFDLTRILVMVLIGLGVIFGGVYLVMTRGDQMNATEIKTKVNSDQNIDPGTTQETKTNNNQTTTTNNQKGNANMVKTLADFEPIEATKAIIKTNKGDIVLDLYSDLAPLTVTNFATLAQSGFYDGVSFHRVIEDFMAQTGDPNTKDPEKMALAGTGGPEYTIEDEFVDSLKHDSAGVLSMANTGSANTGGSQFFITFAATPWLDGKHAVFGKVADENSLAVLMKIKQGDTVERIEIQ